MALNALGADPGRLWRAPWRWLDEDMLSCCVKLDVVKQEGLTIPSFLCLAGCNGATVEAKYGENTGIDEFRRDVEACAVDDIGPRGKVLVVSYNRKDLGQTGTGHFSPIGGYSRERDMVLIMDTARFKYPPHWVMLEHLYTATKAQDPSTGRSRGWMLIERRKDQLTILRFPLHLSSPLWEEVLLRLVPLKDNEKFLESLLEIARDEKLASSIPALIPGLNEEMKNAVKELENFETFKKIGDEFPHGTRVAIALLYESLAQDSEILKLKEGHALRSEAKSIRMVFESLEDYCCIKKKMDQHD